MKYVDPEVETDMNYIRSKPSFWTFEPGLIIRGGGKNIKAQLGVTIGGQDNENYYESPRESVVGYIGISFTFSGKKKL
jgi:hypothetical protein